jgi:hypothetical protein
MKPREQKMALLSGLSKQAAIINGREDLGISLRKIAKSPKRAINPALYISQ